MLYIYIHLCVCVCLCVSLCVCVCVCEGDVIDKTAFSSWKMAKPVSVCVVSLNVCIGVSLCV